LKPKKSVLLLLGILLLAGCSRGEGETVLPPTPTPVPPSPQPSLTPLPPTEATIPPEPTQAPLPTEDFSQLGKPFPLLPEGFEISIKYVEMLNADFGWGLAPGDDGIYHILRTDDGGEVWREITPPQPLTASSAWLYPAVDFSDPQTGWASYQYTDLIWTTKDGGVSWQPNRLEESAMLGGMIHSLDQDRVWFFQYVDGGMQKVYTILYRSEDGGESWTKLLDPYEDAVIQAFDKTGVDFFDADHGWLTRFFRGVSPFISLETTSDGGVTWESLELPQPPSGTDLFSTCMCGVYDPHLSSPAAGSFRLTCQCGSFESPLFKSYLYQTTDGGETWDIQYIPNGDLHFISQGTYYVVDLEIYRTEDGGLNWDKIKDVNWDGQLSFVDDQTALGVALCTDDDKTALVKTTNGCGTFELIEPVLGPSYTIR
jgi:photosystem II stability/assembly factor-like uncharacterized protein